MAFAFAEFMLLFGVGLVVARQLSPETTVVVNGRVTTVTGRRPTVAEALRDADVKAVTAQIRSVATRRVLRHQPPRLTVNGRPGGRSTKLRSGDHVEAFSFPDSTEPVVATRFAPATAGLPDVERQLWRVGGAAQERVGELSGEVAPANHPGREVGAQPETDKVVALTFDDGPDPQWTPQVLAVLRAEGVPATFCPVGTMVAQHPELVSAVVAQGHTLCNHTVHHNMHLDRAPRHQVVAEIRGGGEMIRQATGVEPQFYRPPGGTVSPDIIAVAHELGLRVLHWSVDSEDYNRSSAPVLVRRVLARIGPGAVVLLHDGGGDRSQTVAALRPLIQNLKTQGYRFTTPAMEPSPS